MSLEQIQHPSHLSWDRAQLFDSQNLEDEPSEPAINDDALFRPCLYSKNKPWVYIESIEAFEITFLVASILFIATAALGGAQLVFSFKGLAAVQWTLICMSSVAGLYTLGVGHMKYKLPTENIKKNKEILNQLSAVQSIKEEIKIFNQRERIKNQISNDKQERLWSIPITVLGALLLTSVAVSVLSLYVHTVSSVTLAGRIYAFSAAEMFGVIVLIYTMCRLLFMRKHIAQYYLDKTSVFLKKENGNPLLRKYRSLLGDMDTAYSKNKATIFHDRLYLVACEEKDILAEALAVLAKSNDWFDGIYNDNLEIQELISARQDCQEEQKKVETILCLIPRAMQKLDELMQQFYDLERQLSEFESQNLHDRKALETLFVTCNRLRRECHECRALHRQIKDTDFFIWSQLIEKRILFKSDILKKNIPDNIQKINNNWTDLISRFPDLADLGGI